MIVCLCKAVRQRDVDDHIARGCRTLRDLGRACGAGTDCGSCACDLRAMLGAVEGLDEGDVPPHARQELLAAK